MKTCSISKTKTTKLFLENANIDTKKHTIAIYFMSFFFKGRKQINVLGIKKKKKLIGRGNFFFHTHVIYFYDDSKILTRQARNDKHLANQRCNTDIRHPHCFQSKCFTPWVSFTYYTLVVIWQHCLWIVTSSCQLVDFLFFVQRVFTSTRVHSQ